MTNQNKSQLFLLIGFPLILLVLFLANISIGSVKIPVWKVGEILLGMEGTKSSWINIIWQFRLPKAITATLAGAALSVSGLQMQTLFRNPLAGPFVLGITSGASLGVALLVMAGHMVGSVILYSGTFGHWLTIIAASIGSALVLVLVVIVSIRIKNSMTLLIVGLMFGSATSALVSILQFFSDKEQIQAYLIWTFGSLGGLSWKELNAFVPIAILGLIITLTSIKPLNALLLGENYAQSMGMKLKKTRFWLIFSTSLLAGGVTAFCGPIAFIGLAVPHLTRLLFNSSDHRLLVPAVIFVGAAIMLVCDMVAQLPGSEYVLPINAITSLVGAPVIIWIILRKRNIRNSFAG
ncbi:iron ABC transporter permease [Fulvivirgaceae bacterium BMA10]|uniref:Iron ABC transporter permease n=1 Tax=Splendidivirga corallicola TaxID=3051826 RepID=A0ABT8KPQ6_9BACT|nr:iron ABC transporter permease [Fulvivirgaceae bacterium BMA10]